MREENEWIDSEAVVGDVNNRVGMWVFAKSLSSKDSSGCVFSTSEIHSLIICKSFVINLKIDRIW